MERKLKEKLEEANQMLQVQKDSYDFDPYMHGMYNGMEFVLSIFEEKEPIFLDAPKEWTNNKSAKE